jgi:hypothetical protein
MNPEQKKTKWVVCDAPAGGCGGGRRRRVEVPIAERFCRTCGSQLRVCKNQKPKEAS